MESFLSWVAASSFWLATISEPFLLVNRVYSWKRVLSEDPVKLMLPGRLSVSADSEKCCWLSIRS